MHCAVNPVAMTLLVSGLPVITAGVYGSRQKSVVADLIGAGAIIRTAFCGPALARAIRQSTTV